MRQTTFHWLFSAVLLSAVVFTACKRDFEKPKWDTNILAPFVHTELGIEDIVKDGTGQINGDNSVDLFIRDTLYTLKLDELINISTPPFSLGRKLDSIRFESAPIVTKVSLGMIATQMKASSNPVTAFIGNQIIANNGNPAAIPALSNITGGPFTINISNILEEADIKEGYLDITIINELPVELERVEFKIANNRTPFATIAQPVLNNIVTGDSALSTTDLAGKHVDGELAASILDMDTKSSTGAVVIDTSKAVIVKMKIREVTVSAAVAVFPEQNVIDKGDTVRLEGMGSVKLKQMIMKSGIVKLVVSSTIPERLYFSYDIPGAVKDGIPFHVDTEIPPSGGTTIFSYDMTGYTMDLRGAPPLYNQTNMLYNVLVGKLKYTGNKIPLSLEDSIRIDISFENAKPSYVKGYLGDTTIAYTGYTLLSAFKNITGGTLQFEQAQASVIVENAFGVPGSAVINNLTGYNRRPNGSSATVSSTSTNIQAATDGPPPTIPRDSIKVLNTNTLLSVLPDSLVYNANLNINPSHIYNDQQFAYADYPVKTYMEFRLPLSLTADKLELTQTVELSSVPSFNTAVKKGKINLIADNGFPFSAGVKLFFLDVNGVEMDSLVTDGELLAAPRGGDGKVIESKRSVITYELSPGTIGNIQNAKSVKFKAAFSTVGSHARIYSDYKIKFKLAGDIQYTVNAQQ